MAPSVILVKEPSPEKPASQATTNLGGLALEYYKKAKDYLKQGDWAGYGQQLEKLEDILKQLSKTTADKQ